MTAQHWERSLAWVLAHEGGFVDHPKDPGGPTNKGITQRVYDAYRNRIGADRRSVRDIDDYEVAAIYKRQYWDAVRADELPDGLAYAMFDFAVNSGPKRAIQFLQRIVDVPADGVIGEVTLAAVEACDEVDLIVNLCGERLEWLQTLRTWSTFGKGWQRRIYGEFKGHQIEDNGVVDRAFMLATQPDEADAMPLPLHSAQGKAQPEPERATDGAEGKGAIAQVATGLGAAATGIAALDGTAQIVALAFGAAVVLLGLWIFRGRLRRLAEVE